jgi:hypothetical protein
MMFFIGYMNNTVIKLRVYFNLHMRIVGKIMDIIPKLLHVFI